MADHPLHYPATRSGHQREMLNLMEDLQESLGEVQRLRKLQADVPEYRRVITDKEVNDLVTRALDVLRAGLDRLRAEM